MVVMLVTTPTDRSVLLSFYRRVHPGGPGWKAIAAQAGADGGMHPSTRWRVPEGILCMALGCVAIYGALFATGYWLYGQYGLASVTTVIALAASLALAKAWPKLLQSPEEEAQKG